MNEAKKYVVGALGAGQPMEESGALAKLQARMRGKAARSEGGRRHKAVAAKQFAHGKIGLTVGAADGYDASERATTYGDGLEASPLSNLGGDLIQQKIRPELKLAATPARKSMARGAGSGRRKSQAGRRASSAAGPPKGGRKSRLSKVQMRRAGMAIDKSLDDLITGMNNRAKRRGTTRTPLALQWALSASRRGMTFTKVLDEWFNESDDLMQNGVLSMRELRRGLKILREDGTHNLTDDQINNFAKQMDIDGDGEITKEEFMGEMLGLLREVHAENMIAKSRAKALFSTLEDQDDVKTMYKSETDALDLVDELVDAACATSEENKLRRDRAFATCRVLEEMTTVLQYLPVADVDVFRNGVRPELEPEPDAIDRMATSRVPVSDPPPRAAPESDAGSPGRGDAPPFPGAAPRRSTLQLSRRGTVAARQVGADRGDRDGRGLPTTGEYAARRTTRDERSGTTLIHMDDDDAESLSPSESASLREYEAAIRKRELAELNWAAEQRSTEAEDAGSPARAPGAAKVDEGRAPAVSWQIRHPQAQQKLKAAMTKVVLGDKLARALKAPPGEGKPPRLSPPKGGRSPQRSRSPPGGLPPIRRGSGNGPTKQAPIPKPLPARPQSGGSAATRGDLPILPSLKPTKPSQKTLPLRPNVALRTAHKPSPRFSPRPPLDDGSLAGGSASTTRLADPQRKPEDDALSAATAPAAVAPPRVDPKEDMRPAKAVLVARPNPFLNEFSRPRTRRRFYRPVKHGSFRITPKKSEKFFADVADLVPTRPGTDKSAGGARSPLGPPARTLVPVS